MDNVPPEIPRDQWTSYVDYRYKKETQEMCKRNAENRKKQIIPHTGGSKANSRRRAEMMAETGQMPGRAQLYLATHKNENGAYVNEAAKVICEKIQQTLSQSTVDEFVVSPDDAVGKVLGKEHSGRVRCLGLEAVPSRIFKQARPRFSGMSTSSVSCSFNCQENYNKLLNAHIQSQKNYKEMVNNHYHMMIAFKSYMIMKKGHYRNNLWGYLLLLHQWQIQLITFSLPPPQSIFSSYFIFIPCYMNIFLNGSLTAGICKYLNFHSNIFNILSLF